ncbi:hypothetical protein EB118_10705 [bacterium]|nr:hypothetical protein [bacterium]NDG30527.1 hypothetical protein [bacterium]
MIQSTIHTYDEIVIAAVVNLSSPLNKIITINKTHITRHTILDTICRFVKPDEAMMVQTLIKNITKKKKIYIQLTLWYFVLLCLYYFVLLCITLFVVLCGTLYYFVCSTLWYFVLLCL